MQDLFLDNEEDENEPLTEEEYQDTKEFVEMFGWTLTNRDPLEIWHSDGSNAKGMAAEIVVGYLFQVADELEEDEFEDENDNDTFS